MTGLKEVVGSCLASALRSVAVCSKRQSTGTRCYIGAVALLLSILSTHAQPAIVESPQSETVPPGTVVTMSVVAEGATPLRYYWKFNNRILPIRKPTLRFRATRLRSGTYVAVVRDGTKQQAVSAPAVIQVKLAPVILAQPADVTVHAHDTAVFTVKLNSSGPYTTIVWHNDNPLEGSHQIPDGIGLDVHNPTLVIPNALPVNYYNGLYWLAVTNEAGGTVSRKATLTVLPE